MFERAWTDFDPNATMLIELHRLNEFLLCLPPPLGFKGKDVPEKEIIGTISKCPSESVHVAQCVSANPLLMLCLNGLQNVSICTCSRVTACTSRT